jgi:hypothetical protein
MQPVLSLIKDRSGVAFKHRVFNFLAPMRR